MITYTFWYSWWLDYYEREDILSTPILGLIGFCLTPIMLVIDILCIPFELICLIRQKIWHRKEK